MTGKSEKRRRRSVWRILLGVVLALVLSFVIYVSDYYHADDTARSVLASPCEGVQVDVEKDRVVFTPDEPKAGLIFYPGGKVEYTAYAPLMEELARQGILCVLVRMPLNLAVFSPNAADGIRSEFPDVPVWAVGGHSLGGVMAARYAARHPEEMDALVLLAAYSTSDLSGTDLRVLSVYGSEDSVLNADQYRKCLPNLPDGFTELVIEGGCHAGFGSYGPQRGDGAPSITAAEQRAVTAEAIRALLIPS